MSNVKLDLVFPTFIKPAFFNPYKYSIIKAGRRSGKTYNAAQWSILQMLSQNEQGGLWVDTRQTNIEKYFDRYFKPKLKPIEHYYSWNKQKYVLTMGNGSYLDFGSAERPENLEGFGYDFGVLNEAGHILKKQSLWYETLYPMFKDATVKILGTPKGKNLFHNLYARGLEGNELYKSYSYSAFDSPYSNEGEIEEARKTMPEEIFRQEYMAEFIEGAGSVFRKIKHCIRVAKADLKVDIMSVDLAKHQDFTVVMTGNSEAKQVKSIDRFNQIDWPFQKKRILSIWETNGKPKMIIDSTGVGDAIFDDLKGAGVNVEGFKFNSESKKEIIQNLSIAIDNVSIFFPNFDVLLSELEIFGFELTRSGNITYSAPDGFHDDTVIALALLNHLMKNYKPLKISWV